MICARCGKKITWDNSIGPNHNLRCYPCFVQEALQQNGNTWVALSSLFEKGK
jgi:hypothetical protein